MWSKELADEHARRLSLHESLLSELKTFAELTSVPIGDDIELFEGVRQLWLAFDDIRNSVDDITKGLDQFTQKSKRVAVESEQLLAQLLDEHWKLEVELQNAKAMSASISARVGSIKSKRFLPLLNLIWSLTDKSANCQALCLFEDFGKLVFGLLSRTESRDSIIAALGLLVNITGSARGVATVAKMISENDWQLTVQLIDINKAFGEHRVKQLTLYLIHNLSVDDDFCFSFIRESGMSFVVWTFDEFTEEREMTVLVETINRLTQMQYAKTIEFCCRDDAIELKTKLIGSQYTMARARIDQMLGINAPEGPRFASRFGINRIFP